MKDLYKILGVSRSASQDEVKKAYRKLAKELHPDLHPSDAKIADRFKEATAAYGILGDEKQRGRYDRGEIDDQGNERMAAGFGAGGFGGRGGSRRGQTRRAAGGSAGGEEFSFSPEDFFADIFGGGGRSRGPVPQRGADRIYRVSIGFLDAVRGAKRRISLENGKTLDVNIPKNVRQGQQIRLKGQGGAGANGGPTGDALIEVDITPHPGFRLEGQDIHTDLPITLAEAVLGGEARVLTIDGAVNVKIPPGSNSGKTLRLKAKGVEGKDGRGDQYVHLQIMLPDKIDDKLRRFIEEWSADHPYEVRTVAD